MRFLAAFTLHDAHIARLGNTVKEGRVKTGSEQQAEFCRPLAAVHSLDQVLLKRRKDVQNLLNWNRPKPAVPTFSRTKSTPIPNLWCTYKWIVGVVVFAAYVQLGKGCVCACAFCIFMQICACAQSCSISCRSGNIALLWVGLQKHSNPTPQNILKQKKWFSSDPTYWDHDWTGEDVLLFWWRAVHQTCLQLPKLNWMVRILWFSNFIFIFCCCEPFCCLSTLW